MPAGIARSVFTRKLADALGWHMQTLRDFFNKNGYEAPYTDLHRALRLLKQHNHDITRCLRAVNLRPEDLFPDPQEGGTSLVLASPPSQPKPLNGSDQAYQIAPFSNSPLLNRLARASPGGDTPLNRQTLRDILHAADYDLRCRDEGRAVSILQKAGVVLTHFESRGTAPAEPDQQQNIDNLSERQLRQLVQELLRQREEREMVIARLRLRLNKSNSLLDLSNTRVIKSIRDGRDEITRAEIAALDARAALKEGLMEDGV